MRGVAHRPALVLGLPVVRGGVSRKATPGLRLTMALGLPKFGEPPTLPE